MIKQNKLKLFLIIFCSLLFVNTILARTREAMIQEAEVYKNFIWNCSSNNILDTKNHKDNLNIYPSPNGQDGYDDRAWEWSEENNKWIYSTSNWPYYINTTTAPFVGEAYAWGRNDKYATFQERIDFGKIAGARIEDTDTNPSIPGCENLAPFTGTDCSGFAQRVLGLSNRILDYGEDKYNVIALEGISIKINKNQLKKGDIITTSEPHVIVFKEWENEPTTIANVIHARLSKVKVMEENINISNKDFYSPFPIFSNITPSSSTIMNISTPTIQITIQSGPQTGDNYNKVVSTSVYIIIDKGTSNERIVPNTALTKTPTTNSKSLIITYNVPIANPLSEGKHTIYVYAQNELNLEDDNTDKLHLFTINTTPPEWAGTFDNIDKETNPGNLILAKTQGGNNFDYVYTCDALPDEVGWQRVSYKGTPTIAIENGQLRIETKYRDAFDRDGVTYWKSCENEPISWTDNFTLEYKLNIDNFNNTSNLWFRGACWYGSTIITYYWDDYSGYEVWYNNDILSYNFMGAHIYRVVFRNEGGTEKMDLYIDGEKKATHEHSFGAFGFEIACNSDVTMLMDYFAYTQGAYTPAEKSVFDSSKYVSSGTYTSEVEDIGQVVDWDKISWVSECPVGTSVVWQTRTSNDNIT